VFYSLDLEGLRFALGRSVEAVLPGLEVVERKPTLGSPHPGRRSSVLFLCTHNSARSQMAEAILRHEGQGGVEVASAGSDPRDVNPRALQALTDLGVDGTGLRSKHLSVLADRRFDYVITLCDIVREVCPTFRGDPEHLHWSLPDPVAVTVSPAAAEAGFRHAAEDLATRIRYLLPVLTRYEVV
jgi:protein-tyrosine-phosphatase